MLNNLVIKLFKLDLSFDFKPYLAYCSYDAKKKINSYSQYSDQVVAFASHWIKEFFLGYYLTGKPQKLRIKYSSHGKPYLVDYPNYDFNISHSGEYLLLAISKNGQVGVDIEIIKQDEDLSQLSPIVFSSSEQQLIHNNLHFTQLWTKKEALLKLRGNGFFDDNYLTTQLNLSDMQLYDNCWIYQWQYANYCLACAIQTDYNN
jgi:4'-phosphopantetheinyl transferase